MISRLLFAGSGGQGVLTIGNILGNAGMLEDCHVTFLPEYGAAMRGGTANCTICISDEVIASPVVSSPDFLLALNQPSVNSFINRIQSGGKMMYNSSIVEDVPVRGDIKSFPVPASQLAQNFDSGRSTNMIILGAFVKLSNVVKIETLQKSVEMLMGRKKKVAQSVNKALLIGYEGFPYE